MERYAPFNRYMMYKLWVKPVKQGADNPKLSTDLVSPTYRCKEKRGGRRP